MKTFDDIKFKEHQSVSFHKHGRIDFDNGYGISVVSGDSAYCDEHTYEVGIMHNGAITYDTPFANDVMQNQTPEDITRTMKALQSMSRMSSVDIVNRGLEWLH